MNEPCKQVGKLSALQEKSQNQDIILHGIKQTLEKNNELLGQIAVVMSNINHLAEDNQRNERDINVIYDRIRVLELYPGKAAGKAWWLVFGALAGVVGGVSTTLILGFVRLIQK